MQKVITEEREITSCDDIELNLQRTQKLLYKFSYQKSKKIKSIVFLIHGYGTEPSYMDNLRNFIASNFQVIAVDVYYHCFFSRINNGASLEFDENDLHVIQDLIDRYKIDFSNVTDINTESVVNTINDGIGKLKTQGAFTDDFKYKLPITIVPKNNEYQNFGIMQAIDYINVLHELQNMPFNFEKNYSVTLFGSSHGGYLAHLISKLAPHKIDYVIDNSCYVKAHPIFFLGKELNIIHGIANGEFNIDYENIVLNCFTQTLWSNNKNSPNLFTNNHRRIRDLNDEIHINALPKYMTNKTKYVSYHSSKDRLATIDDKIEFYEKLNALGFDAKLNIIDSESQIDGKFIKTLSHGMDMSLKELARKELSKIGLKEVPENNQEEKIILYECDTASYKFIYKNNTLKVEIL